MFHYSNLGLFGEDLRRFADLQGFVPEGGDDVTDFEYPSGWFDDGDPTAWEDHVSEAVEVTEKSVKELDNWNI